MMSLEMESRFRGGDIIKNYYKLSKTTHLLIKRPEVCNRKVNRFRFDLTLSSNL